MRLLPLPPSVPNERVGMDWEALPDPTGTWNGPARHKMATCCAYGVKGDMRYIEALDRRPGVFAAGDLILVRDFITRPGVIVVAHNAHYDMNLLNGLLGDHPDLGTGYALPSLLYQDTMGSHKWGGAARNGLSERCERASRLGWDVKAKIGSPNWRRIAQGDRAEWLEMRSYCVRDVECALGLEEFYRQSPNEFTIRIRQRS